MEELSRNFLGGTVETAEDLWQSIRCPANQSTIIVSEVSTFMFGRLRLTVYPDVAFV
jgi:hypothetical protein